MIFVGHRLNEVRAVADRVVVLRNGALVSDLAPAEATEQRIVRDMVGKDLLPEGDIAAPGDDETLAFEARALEARAWDRSIWRCARARSSASPG